MFGLDRTQLYVVIVARPIGAAPQWVRDAWIGVGS